IVLARGGGTSLAGQACNVAVVIDFSKYLDRVIEIDPERRRARVQPGVILDDLRDAAAGHGLTFGPDPATHDHCTIGGMIGNDSCGAHSVQSEFYGPGPRTDQNVEALEILTYDGVRMRVGPTPERELDRIIARGGRRGEIHRRLRTLRDRHVDRIREGFPDLLRRVSGYNLPALLPENGFDLSRALVGTEGTCVIVLEATLTLIPEVRERALLVVGYPDVFLAADDVPRVREHRPIALEGFDDVLVRYMRKKGMHPDDIALLPEGAGWLLVEFGGDTAGEAEERARDLMDRLLRDGAVSDVVLHTDAERREKMWRLRESGLGATAFVPAEADTWPGWEDSAVPVDRLGDYLREFRALLDRYGYHASLYGHFGQGCVHTRIDFELRTADGVDRYRAFTREAAELVAHGYGGSLSGEHGDGQARGDLLPIMYGEELMDAFRAFREAWDPDHMMNPGKAIDAAPRSENLRLGPHYRPAAPETRFRYPDDDGSFAHATLRCVGVGKCRRKGGGTMCPSYMVLEEEKHTTRGRAHLLFEMLQGDVITDGWKSEAVKESLDLCLSCKGCKSDCPVDVDIATYKAEFLSHYYDGRLRPRSAYMFGLIHRWARLASLAPGLVNAVTATPGLRRLAKAIAGIPAERAVPRFAPRTFRAWFRERGERNMGGERVVLWPDTFNDHFHPATLAAGVEVLEHAGHRVTVPRTRLCCGRALHEFGMLDAQKRMLREILDALRPELEAGTPVVGLEPSCVAVFRDELRGYFPHDLDAARLAENTFTIGEYVAEHADRFDLPPLRRDALVHGHCHHKAIMGMDGDSAVLSRLGLDHRMLDSGCCGMAGAFGFEKASYDVSVAAGERVLLPAVREAAPSTLIIADGFSCREQIRQRTVRRALHLAEVLQL
ncbi:MAG: FAD-binding and (Fe-S)-binding domain-containing protein, partial [Gemmatimonadota bacterium]